MAKRQTKTTQNQKSKLKAKPADASFCDVVTFLRANLDACHHDSSSGLSPDFPTFELMPQDYLAYAAEALDSPTDANKINCIAHLKRAAECQADTFLHLLSLANHAKTRNFPSKMNAIATLDLMPSRSVAELNRIRNKMEHEYAVPEIADLTLYFDLVAGFVSAVEGAIFMVVSNAELHFWSSADDAERRSFHISYVKGDPELIFDMTVGSSESKFSVKPDEWDTFLKTLRVLFLLIRYGFDLISADFVIKELK